MPDSSLRSSVFPLIATSSGCSVLFAINFTALQVLKSWQSELERITRGLTIFSSTTCPRCSINVALVFQKHVFSLSAGSYTCFQFISCTSSPYALNSNFQMSVLFSTAGFFIFHSWKLGDLNSEEILKRSCIFQSDPSSIQWQCALSSQEQKMWSTPVWSVASSPWSTPAAWKWSVPTSTATTLSGEAPETGFCFLSDLWPVVLCSTSGPAQFSSPVYRNDLALPTKLTPITIMTIYFCWTYHHRQTEVWRDDVIRWIHIINWMAAETIVMLGQGENDEWCES